MDMKLLQDNWKVIVLSGAVLVGVGFGAGRLTVERPKTVTTDVKTEVVKHEDTKVDSKIAEKKVVETDKGPVRIITKTKTTKPDGEVIEQESTTDEGPVKVVSTDQKDQETHLEVKKDEIAKSETKTETKTVSRDWLIGASVSYGIKDVITQKWMSPSLDGQLGYRIFSGVYGTLNSGFDLSAGKAKVGVGIIVTF